MPNSSRTSKVGEMADIAGSYECLNCKYGGTETVVRIERGTILPICATCKDQDTTWHLRKAS